MISFFFKEMNSNYYKPLRVTQLDADSLTNEAFRIFKREIKGSFLNEPFTKFLHLEQEIDVFLLFILWKYSVKKSDSTIGQLNFKMKYISPGGLSDQQKLSYFLLNAARYWIASRQFEILQMFEKLLALSEKNQVLIRVIFSRIGALVELVEFINYVLFIKNGEYLSVIDRFFNWKAIMQDKPSPRYIDYAYMRKELMWSKITETIFCVLPFINFPKLYNLLCSIVRYFGFTRSLKESFLKVNCNICGEKATNPQVSNCSHLFCWYCIKGNVLADGSYRCPACGESILSISPLECEAKK